MGIVFLARDPANSARVAIKLLKPEFVREPRMAHRFSVEARHLQRLKHPGILPLLEVSDRREGAYFVMLLLEKGSLANQIKPGQPLEYKMTLRWARQIA